MRMSLSSSPSSHDMPGLVHMVRTSLAEGRLMLRASLSSFIATVADGIVYQLVLQTVGSYTVAGGMAAAIGGAVNFGINRTWVFRGSQKVLVRQASEYVLASVLTYVAFQTALFSLVELMHADERLSWLPAKAVAWLCVSYPLQRWLVFHRSRQPATAVAAVDEPFRRNS